MQLDQQLRQEMFLILLACIDDVDAEIFQKLREQNGRPRQDLLAQLDVITAVRGKLDARFSYRNPANRIDGP
jgi:hypothetical protein